VETRPQEPETSQLDAAAATTATTTARTVRRHGRRLFDPADVQTILQHPDIQTMCRDKRVDSAKLREVLKSDVALQELERRYTVEKIRDRIRTEYRKGK
jgi:hypothetical protein